MAKDKRTFVSFDRANYKFIGLTSDLKEELKKTYKGINLESELTKMMIWLISSKGLMHKGNFSFIKNWLNRAYQEVLPPSSDEDTTLADLFKDYLKDLWKNREHILEFNTLRR